MLRGGEQRTVKVLVGRKLEWALTVPESKKMHFNVNGVEIVSYNVIRYLV